MADLGNTGTLTFGTSSWTGTFISIEPGEITREAIATSHLGTSGGRTYLVGELYEPGEVSATIQYDPNDPPPYTAAAETITVKYPKTSTTSTSNASMAGSGFISSFTPGRLGVDELIESDITIKFSGSLTFADENT